MSEFVLDASALLALIQGEAGAERVAEVLDRTVISAINLAEVVTRLADRGVPGKAIRRQLVRLGLSLVSVDEDLAYAAGLLRPVTRAFGLSLGDRVCIALARRLGATALTTDRAWARLEIGVAIELVRAD
ncbi:MAG TPA: type II toxin-antitoxin system VapC family toxin [Geminicoccaceae bacterium]|nr:type II toxin-antitoxin system VapC family toxin [Geminicoccaceae bacterium]